MTSSTSEVWDLLILIDATASMQTYINALNKSLPKIISVSALTDCFARIGILAYRDYNEGDLTLWSGWCGDGEDTTREELIKFAKDLKPEFGGDWPEAAKTGFAQAYSLIREEAKTLFMVYTDAPPHMIWNTHRNRFQEQKHLATNPFGTSDELFRDWVSASKHLQYGPKKVQVFALVQSSLIDTLSPFAYLCHRNNGVCLELTGNPTENVISTLSMNLLLNWMGVEKEKAPVKNGKKPEVVHPSGKWLQYKMLDLIEELTDERDKRANVFFLQKDTKEATDTARGNIQSTEVNTEWKPVKGRTEPLRIPGRPTSVQNFAKRYASDADYKRIVVTHLRAIIKEDVSSIAINPIFGTLWRAVCNDRSNEDRDDLIRDFGASIDSIVRIDQKEEMKAWLAESYNYAAEIASIIEEVAPEDRFPCVFLDPTEDWSAPPAEDDKDGAENRPINSFTRDELLEIGRSCDHKILRRLGQVLTKLTYVRSAEKLPAHIKLMSEEEVPRIPLALAKEIYKSTFWKILLHIVVPGTKLSPRPAALLAALSIKMGMKPLLPAAEREMLGYKDKWNSLDIPEIWNTNCLSLILDAETDLRARQAAGISSSTLAKEDAAQTDSKSQSYLNDNDYSLFTTLVEYSLLKLNLNTTVEAKVGWSPSRAKIPIGPLIICKSCKYPRSVTVMARDGICGLCATPESEYLNCHYKREKAQSVESNISRDHTAASEATWVECFDEVCRAQYIVYDLKAFNVRAKCHYCRQAGQSGKATKERAPCIECTHCLSRMLWPEEYRPEDLDVETFKCIACQHEKQTIVTVETSASKLQEENGTSWMMCNKDRKIRKPFGNESLFKTISAAGVEDFAARVQILPKLDDGVEEEVRIKGKLVQNIAEVKDSLRQWIKSRQVEAGCCSLCFSNFKKQDLRSACGRSGCQQKICKSCATSWYSINGPGRILNVAALCCPFCRRQPIPKLAGSIATLGNLRGAVEEAGAWIYAWCRDCGVAKAYMERVCARGPPPDETAWRCSSCLDELTVSSQNKYKSCPGCDVMTEKWSGCDHITCGNCNTHWCFYCGEKSTEHQIYEHIWAAHGGLFQGQENEHGNYDYWTDEGED